MIKIKKTSKDEGKFIFGVASGLAAHFGINPWIIRVIFLVITAFFSIGFWVYLILNFLMEKSN